MRRESLLSKRATTISKLICLNLDGAIVAILVNEILSGEMILKLSGQGRPGEHRREPFSRSSSW